MDRCASSLRYIKLCCLLLVICFAGPVACAPAGAQSIAGSSSPIAMIAQHDYHQAAGAVADMPAPGDRTTLCAKAILLLYSGRCAEANQCFALLRTETPSDDALADYGEALSCLGQDDLHGASVCVARCIASPQYSEHRSQIGMLDALIHTALGKSSLRSGDTLDPTSPLGQEIQAFNILRDEPRSDAAAAVIRRPPWYSSVGLPRVVEDPGLLASGLLLIQAHAPLIDTPLDESGGADAAQRASAGRGKTALKAQGSLTLSPASGAATTAGDVATYYVDGAMTAVVNGASLSYTWDTTRVQNGQHTVTILVSSASGTSTSETRIYDVQNAMSASNPSNLSGFAQRTPLAAEDLSLAWQALELGPCYRIGEEAIARACIERGNRLDAAIHLATAAALDFRKGSAGMPAVTAAFGHRLPISFRLAAGAHGIDPDANPKTVANKRRSIGIWRGDPDSRDIALTFDDGPSATDTPPLLAALRKARAPGTFFVVGKRAEAAPETLQRMASDGDEVEDHSYSHPNLDESLTPHIYEEILRDAAIVDAVTGIWPHFLRPPGGQSNPHVLQAAAACGMTGAFWTIDALPAENTGSPSRVVNLVLGKIKPGAIVLMHNDMYSTTHAIPALVAGLRARGYRLVTLLQLANDASASPNGPSAGDHGTKLAKSVFRR